MKITRTDAFAEDDEKRLRLLEIIGQYPEVVVLFAGAMRFDVVSGKYVSGSYSDADENSGLISAGEDRIFAARDIHKYFPETVFVTTSRTRDLEKPTYASVMKRELVEFGVPEADIIEESDSVDTVTCAKAVMRMIDTNGWKHIVFLSAAFHLPRIQAIWERLDDFSTNENERDFLCLMLRRFREGVFKVTIASSDDVLEETDPVYAKTLRAIRKSGAYRKKLSAELGGAERIRMGGEYNGYVLPENHPSLSNSFELNG